YDIIKQTANHTFCLEPVMCAAFFFSSRRRHTISKRDWSSDVCSSDLSGDKRRRWLPLTACGYRLLPGGISTPRLAVKTQLATARSEERRVGKECRAQWGTFI